MERANRKRSAVWNHFVESGPNKAKCSYCISELSLSGGNVGNLNRHLRSKHPTVKLIEERQQAVASAEPEPLLNALESQEVGVQIQPSIITSTTQPSIKMYAQCTKPIPPRRAQTIDEQLIKMIAKGHYPLRMVEDEEFKKLISMLNAQYTLPTRKTLSETILPRIFNKCVEMVKSELQEQQAFCLTTDGWTSINNESFLALTVHYISVTPNSIKLTSNLLGCVEYNARHTSENLTAFLRDKMTEWNLSEYTTAIVSDNAANITAAIKDTGRWHIPCFAHSINLCVQACLTPVSETLKKVKTIVEFFKRSSHAQIKLREMQNQLNLTVLKIKQDVPTRWNSTYDMLNRILSAKDAIIATIAIMRPELALNIDDWTIIEGIGSILRIFYEITKEISAEKNVSLSKIIPLCSIMKNNVTAHRTNNTLPTQVQLLLNILEKQLEDRFGKIERHVLNAEATILDPRFKNKGFSNIANFNLAVVALKRKVGRVQQQVSTTSMPSTSASQPSTSVAPITNPSYVWGTFDKEVVNLTPSNPLAAGIAELDKYLQEPLLPRCNDPLHWWHERRLIYPILFKYVLKRLHLVATSVPCERIFSKAGQTLNERRTRLTTKKLSQLLFISSNCN